MLHKSGTENVCRCFTQKDCKTKLIKQHVDASLTVCERVLGHELSRHLNLLTEA